uniref:Uncharacterized protein n=1 Tax=Oryza barthii TaxID=65489 RepID=A0A0D3FXZ7_9ORYZ
MASSDEIQYRAAPARDVEARNNLPAAAPARDVVPGGGRRAGLSSLLMAPLVGEHSGGGGWYDQRRDGSSPWSVALARW